MDIVINHLLKYVGNKLSMEPLVARITFFHDESPGHNEVFIRNKLLIN